MGWRSSCGRSASGSHACRSSPAVRRRSARSRSCSRSSSRGRARSTCWTRSRPRSTTPTSAASSSGCVAAPTARSSSSSRTRRRRWRPPTCSTASRWQATASRRSSRGGCRAKSAPRAPRALRSGGARAAERAARGRLVLYAAAEFEPLADRRWQEERVRAALRGIVADTEAAFAPVGLWPANEWAAWGSTPPLKDLYCGAAGVIWALDALARRGHAETGIDLPAAAERTLELWREAPDLAEAEIELPAARESSLLCGEAGLLLVSWRLTARADLADRLLQRVHENRDNEFEELLWGSPGTLLAARAMHESTGEERWLEAWRESAGALMARRDPDGLWTQQLYGSTERLLGPTHGLVGIVHALLRAESEWSESLPRETAEILAREAIVEDGVATWPADAGGAPAPPRGRGNRPPRG